MDQYRNWRFSLFLSLFLSPSFIFCLAWGVRRENGEERDASLPPSPVHRFIHEGVSYFLFLSFRFRSARSLAISRIQLGKFALPAIVYFLSILFSICPRFSFSSVSFFCVRRFLCRPSRPPSRECLCLERCVCLWILWSSSPSTSDRACVNVFVFVCMCVCDEWERNNDSNHIKRIKKATVTGRIFNTDAGSTPITSLKEPFGSTSAQKVLFQCEQKRN